MCMSLCGHIFISLGELRGCGIAGLYGEFIFNFIRNCQFAFHGDFLLSTFYIFTFSPVMFEDGTWIF